MKRLGAILAGGQSRRFGSDKAEAMIDGTRLLDHMVDALVEQVDAIVVVGREWPGQATLWDRPDRDMGPLGGLNAALHCAKEHGFDIVLTCGCDTLPMADFAALEGEGAAVVADQPLFGVWPVALADMLDDHLTSQNDRSMKGWIERSGARRVDLSMTFYNLNTAEELAHYQGVKGMAA